jgi:hypothetical protein
VICDEELAFHLIDAHGDPWAICRGVTGNTIQHKADHAGPIFCNEDETDLIFDEKIVEYVLERYEAYEAAIAQMRKAR